LASKQFWYLDTSYLLSYISKQPWSEWLSEDKEQARTARSVIQRLGSENVKVPVIVWGEVVTQLREKGVNMGITPMLSDFETAWLKREETNIFSQIVRKLSERDARLQPFDCLIVAFAMACSECRGLLTFDTRLIKSKAIQEILKEEYGNRSFIVSDGPW